MVLVYLELLKSSKFNENWIFVKFESLISSRFYSKFASYRFENLKKSLNLVQF